MTIYCRTMQNAGFLMGIWLMMLGFGMKTVDAQQTFMVPVQNGKLACTFNTTNCAVIGKYHAGIDYWGPSYACVPVLATNVGTVYSMTVNGQNDHGMGNCLILRHAVVVSSNGSTATYYTLYAHLDSFANGLKAGQAVTRGQVIGAMGSSGYGNRTYWGNTPHLHFEVKSSGVLHNPYGGGPYWGYTPKPAQNYGYTDPAAVIGKWTAVPKSK